MAEFPEQGDLWGTISAM